MEERKEDAGPKIKKKTKKGKKGSKSGAGINWLFV